MSSTNSSGAAVRSATRRTLATVRLCTLDRLPARDEVHSAYDHPVVDGVLLGAQLGGDGRGCNELTGEFTIRELAFDPALGMSARFEGGAAALRGMIDFQANGKPDVAIVASKTIPLLGKVSRLRYEPSSHMAYGLDFANRNFVRIDVRSGMLQINSVVQVPNDLCVSACS